MQDDASVQNQTILLFLLIKLVINLRILQNTKSINVIKSTYHGFLFFKEYVIVRRNKYIGLTKLNCESIEKREKVII